MSHSGRSRADALKAANQRLPKEQKPLAKSTVSDWFRGESVPKQFDQLWALVEVLVQWRGLDVSTPRGKAGMHAKRLTWQELWDGARGSTTEPSAVQTATLGNPIEDLDPIRHLEVHPAVQAGQGGSDLGPLPLYVPRNHDWQLRDEVEQARVSSRLVVLVGDSSTGKTRALWEAIQHLSGWRLWRPADRTALVDGLARHASLARTVIWLNETQRYLLSSSPTAANNAAVALRDLLASPGRGPVLVLGTLWRDAHDVLTTAPASHLDPDDNAQARTLLSGGLVIDVAEGFDDDALAEARRAAASDVRLDEALRHGGRRITQYLAGGWALVYRYEHARPEARALLDVAADARRLGHGEALHEAFLRAAAAAYVDPEHWRTQTEQWRATWYEQATAYTSHPWRGVPGPLTPDIPPPGHPSPAERCYRLADYLLQYTETTRRCHVPPTAFWEAAAQHLTDSDDLRALAGAAYFRLRLRYADSLLHRLLEVDNGNLHGLRFLARLREAVGDRRSAEQIYRRAPDHDHWARKNLARLREEAGDREEAERIYRKIGEFDPTALRNLARLRKEAGDPEEAERIYRILRADPYADRWMRYQDRIADRKDAHFIYRHATATGEHQLALAKLREKAGNREGVEQLARQAADAGDASPLRALAATTMGEEGQRLLRYGLESDGSISPPWW
ncbi:tetratricopeptide repeat protein [Streptomyces afghaniensis]|uniref:tetratricopeptide repeat protein n=1 Tax=Streptomyces afghaniensis TaxID=66865 RepID=UPI0037AA5E2A